MNNCQTVTAKSNKIDPPIAQPNAVFFEEYTLTGQAAQQNWRYQPDGTRETSEMGNQRHHERGKDIGNRRRYRTINQLIDSQQSDFSFDDL